MESEKVSVQEVWAYWFSSE